MRVKPSRVAAAAVAIAAAAFPPIQAPASAAPAQPTDNFVWSQSNPTLVDATQVTLPGQLIEGGCSFDAPKLTLAPDQQAVEADQIAVDPSTCNAIWQVGTPEAVVSTPDVDAGAELVGASASAGAICNDCTSAKAKKLTSSSGYERGWVTDPPGITLASTKSTLSWSYDGTCVRSGSGAYQYYWHSSTGWSKPKNPYSYIYSYCDYDQVSSGADFEDNNFWTDPCWPMDTWIHFHYIDVYGWFDGTLGGEYSIFMNGDCVTLYIHHQLKRET